MSNTLEVEVKNVNIVNVNKLRAYVDVVLGGCLVVNGYKVVEGQKGLFVANPARPSKNKQTGQDEWSDVLYFTKESNMRDVLSTKVMAAYKQKLSEQQQASAAAGI